ncbi:MAG TPA: OmpH family outer membrane protein [Terracidiphilus sp.]|jgi:outer membrane protein|nr:OmpH family outer membrane protein [Terracidiphilus sp.]
MIRHTAVAAALVAGFSLSAAAQAPAAPAAEPVHVAVVSFQTAVTQTNEFQRNFADLQKKYDPKRQALQTLSSQVDELKKQLQTQAGSLSDNERQSRAKTLDEKERELQRNQQDDQSDFQQDLQQTFSGVATKVGELVVSYAKQHGYTLVLDGGNPDTQLVLYVGPGVDITKTIIEAYNVKSGVPAPVPASPAAPRPAAPRHAAPQH